MKKCKILLLLFFSIHSFLAAGEILPSCSPGVYTHDITLSFSPENLPFLYYSFRNPAHSSPVKYTVPLVLTALPGERRVYVLKVFLKDTDTSSPPDVKAFTYIIDKTVPLPPEITLSDGVYDHSLDFRFKKSPYKIFYMLSMNSPGKYIRWDGSPLHLNQTASMKNSTLRAYSVSTSGNKSCEMVKRFSLLPLKPTENTLHVYSPVRGIFLNSQLLYIDLKGYKWVRYSIGNSDPAKFGTSYRHPILFKEKGTYLLHIAGLPYRGTKIIRKTIKFTIRDGSNVLNVPKSGVYQEPLRIKLKGSQLRYALSDSETSYHLYGSPFSLMPVEGMVTYVPLRISLPGRSGEGEYRYFYVFDERKPGTPLIHVQMNTLYKKAKVSIEGPSHAKIYYTLDGSTPDRYARLYRRPFEINFPHEIKTGSRIIKAVSCFDNGRESSPAVSLVPFDFLPPAKPVIAFKKINQHTFSLSIENKQHNTFFYTLSYDGTEPRNPDNTSFIGEKESYLFFPYGISGKVKLKGIFMDEAGNFSAVSSVSIPFDTIPPDPPEIGIEGNTITLQGKNNTVYYALQKEKRNKKNLFFTQYEKPFSVSSSGNIRNITAYAIDAFGNRSKTVEWSFPYFTKGIKDGFSYSGISDGGIYNTSRTMSVYPAPHVTLYYRLTDNGNMPEDPLPEPSLRMHGLVRFQTEEGKKKRFIIKILAVPDNEPARRKITKLSFIIDRQPPPVPVFTSIVNGAVYNRPVTFSVKRTDDMVWILCKKRIEPRELNSLSAYMKEGVRLKRMMTLDVNPGEDKEFQISAVAFDNAGNYTFSNTPVTIRIDKIPPEPPVLSGISFHEETNKSVAFSLYSGKKDTLYYNLTTDGTVPGRDSGTLYRKPVTLQRKENVLCSYIVRAWSVDEAGNCSRQSALAAVTISGIKVPPVMPRIRYITGNTVSVSFPPLSESKIYYKWGKEPFSLYHNPFLVSLRENGRNDSLFSYLVDRFGNRSPITVRIVQSDNKKSTLVTGVKKGGLYAFPVTIKKRNAGSLIRYEVSSQGKASDVTYFSPELTEPLTFDPGKGKAITLTMNVMAFDRYTRLPDSPEEHFTFTIDRSIPAKPKILGVQNNEYYQSGRILTLSSRDGTIYYSVRRNKAGSDTYKKYTAPLHIDAGRGEIAHFTVKAYTEDRAGNRSSLVSVCFSIDRAVVYLSSSGKDTYDGSRSRPFRSFHRALEQAVKTGKKKIYVTAGAFFLPEEQTLQSDLLIQGGFGSSGWKRNGGETVFTREQSGKNRNVPLFSVLRGNIVIKNVVFTNTGVDTTLVHQKGGSLCLDDVTVIYANGNGVNAVKSEGGTIALANTKFFVGPVRNAVLVSLAHCAFQINKMTVKGSSIFDRMKIFSITKGASGSFNDLVMNSLSGNVLEYFTIADSSVTIENSSIALGKGTISTAGFIVKDSLLTMKKFHFSGKSESRILSFLDSENAKITIADGMITGSSKSGVSFFTMNNSVLHLHKIHAQAENTPDFIYMIRAVSSEIDADNSMFHIGKSTDTSFMTASGSALHFVHNRTIAAGGSPFVLFSLKKMKEIDLNNNTFTQKERSATVPVLITGRGKISIEKNIFRNWYALVRNNGVVLGTEEELNTYAGFSSPPSGNLSR